jgi:phosphoribosylaminoimidazolecarboxamide formyltransferase/IMP cyclohydrolase
VVVDADDYAQVATELDANHCSISADTRWRLARKAFARVAAYDAAISNYLGTHTGGRAAPTLGETFSLSLEREQLLRYGENPHQSGALYGRFLEIAHQLHGKELSFNNVVDISSAMNLMLEFQDERRAVVAILKHNTPCGVGVADTLKGAWDKAFGTDPDSPFGGIIIANRAWNMEFARAVDELFTEVLIGPSYPDEVIAFLRRKKNRRVMTFNPAAIDRNELDIKKVLGGLLVQTPDLSIEDPSESKIVTQRAPTDAEMRAFKFGIKVCKHIKSNAIVFVGEDRTLAVGGGATSRIDPVYAAREKAARLHVSLQGSVLVSEALFPFPDGPTLAAEAGATAIAQPGGSARDDEVIAAADKYGLAMVFTGVRHFRH